MSPRMDAGRGAAVPDTPRRPVWNFCPAPDVGNPWLALISEPEAFDCGIWT